MSDIETLANLASEFSKLCTLVSLGKTTQDQKDTLVYLAQVLERTARKLPVTMTCEWCGGEFESKGRANSKPFCKKGHQTRYYERARRAFDSGVATAHELCADFPAISCETIDGWAQSKGGGMSCRDCRYARVQSFKGKPKARGNLFCSEWPGREVSADDFCSSFIKKDER